MNSINRNPVAVDVASSLNSHYGRLATSVKRMSTGLRINATADDAAGLAIRELMRVNVAALNQGVRNANDAISMIQVADGALGIIDEKLIRMKELAEQAATGTYNSTQRLMINSEFTAMGEEIDRIAKSTDFNGIKLLDGSINGMHEGGGLNPTGKMKIHFGSGNDSAEDYYYVEIGDCTLGGLGLREGYPNMTTGGPASMQDLPGATSTGYSATNLSSGLVPMAYIPKGSRNVVITIDGQFGEEDDIQLFTRNGCHLAGTRITSGADNDYSWSSNNVGSPGDAAIFMTEANGFLANASYKLPGHASGVAGSFNDGLAGKTDATWNVNNLTAATYTINGKNMTISYSGDYDRLDPGTRDNLYDNMFDNNNKYPAQPNNGWITDLGFRGEKTSEKITIDEAADDILVIISGKVRFDITATWDYMAVPGMDPVELVPDPNGEIVSIKTQEQAQKTLTKLDAAMIEKDKVRAHLGAMQNRLENTATNLASQAENLQAAESRISDADIAQEMTNFVRNQILTQSAVAMLSQANSYPRMLSVLISS